MNSLVSLAWLIILSPVIASFIIFIIGRKLYSGGAYVAIGSSIVSLLLSLYLLFNVPELSKGVVVEGYNLIPNFSVGNVTIEGISFSLFLDNLSVLTSLVVAIVSTLIFIFSIEYMRNDPGIVRYFSEITFFVGSMEGLVLANNIILLFLFWEFVGLASYLLIGFWYEREEVAAAAKKAFIVTRIADFFFLSGILLLWINLGTLPTVDQILRGNYLNTISGLGLGVIVPLLFFTGAIGKSAQFPLHVWLPDAMEGPTTVSALIHSATMVAAGAYLVARLYPLFEISYIDLLFIATIGGFTAFFAGTMAIVSKDIKRILAYSTVSQLGYMMLGLGIGIPAYAIMHLYSHAFFKALMFLSAGVIIHQLGTRNIFSMGGLSKTMRASYYGMLIGGLSLIGIPPFSGFFTKDPIIEISYETNIYLFIFAYLGSLITAVYWFRLLQYTYFGEPHSEKAKEEGHETIEEKIPIYVFIALVTIFGILMYAIDLPSFIGGSLLEFSSFSIIFGTLMVLTSLAGIYIFYGYLIGFKPLKLIKESKIGSGIYYMLEKGYFFDYAYEKIAIFLGWIAGEIMNIIDLKGIDGFVNYLADSTKKFGMSLRRMNSGDIEQYLFIAFVMAIIIFTLSLII